MKIVIISVVVLLSTLLNATTIYYNGEGNDVGEWRISAVHSGPRANLREVHDNTLNSNVMSFTEQGVYQLRLPGGRLLDNRREHVLSLDMNLDSDFTLSVYVETDNGIREIFYNRLNINVGQHNKAIGIRVAVGENRLFRVGAHHSGWGNHPEARNNRNGWVRLTLDLERQLRDTEPDNHLRSVLSIRMAGTSGRIDNVTLDNPVRVTRASRNTDWHLTHGVPLGGRVNLVQDNIRRGSVIEFDGAVNSNSFTTGARVGRGRWNDRVHDIIQWKMQTEDRYKFIVHVLTTNGLRDMVYHGGKRRDAGDRWWRESMDAIVERGLEAEHNEIYIGLGVRKHRGDSSPDNNHDGIGDYDSGTGPTWQTFTRNLATDVAEFENGNSLIAVNGVTVIGTNIFEHNSAMIDSTIRVDDIQLFTSITPTATVEVDSNPATNLRWWRRQQTSILVSFIDRSEGERGFRYINADTGETIGSQLIGLEGRGTAGIGLINHLTPATTYRVQVETIFADTQNNTLSEPITFTTRP